MKRKTQPPTVTLRVRVTPELRAALAWKLGIRTLNEVRKSLIEVLEWSIEELVSQHKRDTATGPDTPVDDLELTLRTANLLQELKLETAQEVVDYFLAVRKHRHFSPKVHAALRAALAPLGLKLREDP